MATMALNVAGLYMGSGGFTSAFVVGGLSMLYSSRQKVKGPQLEDRNPPESRLGQPIPKPFGTVPMTGQIIWAPPLEEREQEVDSGGKGAPEQTEFVYSASYGVMFGAGPINTIKQLRFNEKVVWAYNGGIEDGVAWILGKKVGGTYWNRDAATGTWTSKNGKVRLRLGTENQLPDADEEADKGAGNVPAYLGRVTLHVSDLPLKKFGNARPTVTILADEGTFTCDAVATWVCEQVGLGSDKVDMTELGDVEFEGFTIESRMVASQVLDQIGTYAQCDWPERDSGDGVKITAWRRGRTAEFVIAEDELYAHDSGSELPDDRISRVEEVRIPSRVRVGGLNPARQYTVDYGTSWSEVEGTSDEEAEVVTQFVCSKRRLNLIAEIERLRRRTERLTRNISVTPVHAWLANSDPVLMDTALGRRSFLLAQSQEGLFGVCTFSTMLYDAGIYDSLEFGDEGGLPPALVVGLDGFTYAIFDVNAPSDDLNDAPVLMIAATTPYNADYDDAVFSSSAFVPVNDQRKVVANRRCTMGELVSAVPPLQHIAGYDDTSSITVDLVYGSLTNADDDALQNGANRCVLGNEGFQYGNAQYIGEFGGKKRYKLTHLVRGRRGSETWATQGHAAGEAFVLLDSRVKFVRYLPQYIGGPINIGVTAPDESITEISKTVYARNLMPYAPHSIQGVRDESNNLAVTWLRRSRYSSNWWATGLDPLLGEATESYDVEALNGAGSVVRTWAGVTTPTIEYSSAQQTADGLVAGAQVRLKVYQLSATVGRGYAAEATV